MKRPACDVIANRRVLKLRPSYPKPSRRRTELAGAQDLSATGRRTPTRVLRTKRKAHSASVSSGRSDQLQPPNVSSGRSDQLQPPDGCPTGEGLITPTAGRVQREKGLSLQPAGRGRERRAYHSVHRPALPAKGLITPHWQHSLVGDSTVMPVQEGSRTQVSRAGNSGKA